MNQLKQVFKLSEWTMRFSMPIRGLLACLFAAHVANSTHDYEVRLKIKLYILVV